MIKFEEGNEESPLGTAYIYGRTNDDSNIVMACFLSTGKDLCARLLEKVLNEENIENKLDEILENTEQDEDTPQNKLLTFYSTSPLQCSYKSFRNLANEIRGDIINVGTFHSETALLYAIVTNSVLYQSKYVDNFMHEVGIPMDSDEYEKKEDSPDERLQLLIDLDKSNLITYIVKKYISPLQLHKDRDEGDYLKTKKDFLLSAKGSHFIVDIRDICFEIDNQNRHEVIEAYLSKIDAINKEDFESAGKIRDRIHSLNA